MNILITGGTGLVGSKLVQRLAEEKIIFMCLHAARKSIVIPSLSLISVTNIQ